jgi:hypothetical protein
MAYKHQKASDLKDLNLFTKVYNDPSLTNQQVMDKLNAEWNAIKVKVASNGTLKATLTLVRSGGANGTVTNLDGSAVDPKAAPAKAPAKEKAEKKTAAKTESAGTTASAEAGEETPKFATEEVKEVPFVINYRVGKYGGNGSAGPVKTVTGVNQLDAENKFHDAVAGERISKYSIYLNGAMTDSSSIPNGATVEVRPVNKAGGTDEEEISGGEEE